MYEKTDLLADWLTEKRTVAVLPAESIVHFAFEDLARTGFEILDQFGERNLSGETAKNMDMIRHSSDLKRSTVLSKFRLNKHAPAIGLPLTAKVDFDFWWRK